MGTNYYYTKKPPCECCGREYPEIHIGKSSVGWKFGFRAVDESDSWAKMRDRLLSAHEIHDEFGRSVTVGDLDALVSSKLSGRSITEPSVGSTNSFLDQEGHDMTIGDFS